jgi:crotonobetainyl-CoA:carnitine CoA-transferase CaiB-like acyl-CoA transferase
MSGYFLATGIIAALYKQMTEGGSWQVDVSLAGAMQYARSLGQMEGKSGFDCKNYEQQSDVPADFLEARDSGFGKLVALRHSPSIEGVRIGWDLMPKRLGSDPATWLERGIKSSI